MSANQTDPHVAPRPRASAGRRFHVPGIAALATAVLIPLIAGSVAALDEGARAPEIGLKDTQGRVVRMADLRGKVVIVDFWASWCDPCREEMPALERMHRKYRSDGLVVVGVSVDRDAKAMRDFLSRTPVSFPIVHDVKHQVAGRYEPPRMPSTFLVDRSGVVRYVHGGFRNGDAERLESKVQALLR